MPTRKILLKNLVLDASNPRFILPKTDISQEAIFEYLMDIENLQEVVESIIELEFNVLGERVIVKETENKYLVVEGNRRICALQYLHGFFSKKYPGTVKKTIIESTLKIEVDIATSDEEVQKVLALRHIIGIREWKPEAKRKFYGEHYLNGKSISDINKMSSERKGLVTQYIREYIFLKEMKSLLGTDIKNPSIIYERLYHFLVNIEVINEVNLPGKKISNEFIEYNTSFLSKEEDIELITHLLKMIVDDKIIDSRKYAQNEVQFVSFMTSLDLKKHDERAYDIYQKLINQKLLSSKIIEPIQKKSDIFIDHKLDISDIIDCQGITEKVEFITDNLERKVFEDLKLLPIGKYILKVGAWSKGLLNVKDTITPEVVFTKLFDDIYIGNSYRLSALICVKGIHNEDISLTDTNLCIIVSTGITINGDEIIITSPDLVSIKVIYTATNTQHSSVDKTREFTARPRIITNTVAKDDRVYFKKRIVDIKFSGTVGSLMINELEMAYGTGKLYHVFASALRSLIECYMHEFFSEAQRVNPLSYYSKAPDDSFNSISLLFLNMYPINNFFYVTEYKNMLTVYSSRNRLTYKELNGYFNTYLSYEKLSQVISTLHLGAHTSLMLLSKEAIDNIRDTLVAWITMMDLIKSMKYPY